MALHGIDVSSYQAGIDFAAVPGDFAIIKATGGTSYVNPACDAQFQSAKAAGKRKALYHFAREQGCSGSAVDEANHFVDSIQGYLDGHVLLILDFEGDNMTDVAWALTWLNTVYARTGIKPLIYLNSPAINGADWAPVWTADYGLWLAWYAVTTPTQGYNDYAGRPSETVPVPMTWGGGAPAMWQFTSTAQLPGWAGSLDASVFYGDEAAWDAYCNPSGAAPAAPAAPAPAPAPVPAPAPAPAAGPGQCVVSPGDTFSAIAAQFGVSLAALEAANPGLNYDLIHPGQVLNLPGAAVPAPAPAPAAPATQCVVSPGDTMSGIAAQFGVDLGALEAANPSVNPDLIFPGQVLNLP